MEGPSLVILAEELARFKGKKVVTAEGSAPIDMAGLGGKTLKQARSWGKHLLLFFENETYRIHFLMFGSYRIDEKRDREPKLSLRFGESEVNFYSCAIKRISKSDLAAYDLTRDLMSPHWDSRAAERKLFAQPERLACDALLDQEIFAGLGNIIKNEVLFNLHLHPETPIGALKAIRIKELVHEARSYSMKFYDWKKNNELKKNWKIFRKRKCPNCSYRLEIRKTGLGERVSFFCSSCQRMAVPTLAPKVRRRPGGASLSL